jgi:hypothetical protein
LPVEILASQTFALEDGAQAMDRAKGAEAGKCFLVSRRVAAEMGSDTVL